ncbi:hypothetical protein [Lysobacter gummosus]|uniref:hypothetical protein n=1 Tax=Lysobacter gummosus TaxID=262324 RepID=UPI003627D138
MVLHSPMAGLPGSINRRRVRAGARQRLLPRANDRGSVDGGEYESHRQHGGGQGQSDLLVMPFH